MIEERTDAKVTFVVHRGEVTAVFRAVRDSTGRWVRNPDARWGRRGLMLTCYVHNGQHGECDRRLLKCRRATPEEYTPLLEEMTGIVGYNIELLQRGRLKLKGKSGWNSKI